MSRANIPRPSGTNERPFASIFTAQLGAKLAHRIDIAQLRKLFAVLPALASKLLLKVL